MGVSVCLIPPFAMRLRMWQDLGVERNARRASNSSLKLSFSFVVRPWFTIRVALPVSACDSTRYHARGFSLATSLIGPSRDRS